MSPVGPSRSQLKSFGICLETSLTLRDVLSKVPEDHPLQLTHLALNKTGICIDSFTFPHLHSLTSLELRNLPSPSNYFANLANPGQEWVNSTSISDTFAILKEGIPPKHVVSDVGVFDYLCSYSCLETLDLCCMWLDSHEETNRSARTFFCRIELYIIFTVYHFHSWDCVLHQYKDNLDDAVCPRWSHFSGRTKSQQGLFIVDLITRRPIIQPTHPQ